jgi:hypothetical protein
MWSALLPGARVVVASFDRVASASIPLTIAWQHVANASRELPSIFGRFAGLQPSRSAPLGHFGAEVIPPKDAAPLDEIPARGLSWGHASHDASRGGASPPDDAQRLDASRIALRVARTAIGGVLFENTLVRTLAEPTPER